MQENKRFIRNHVIACGSALLAMAVLALGSFIVLHQNIKQETSTAYKMGSSGFQHMLSQRIPLLGLSLFSTHDDNLRNRLRVEIRDLADQMEKTHLKLLDEIFLNDNKFASNSDLHKLYFSELSNLDQKIRTFAQHTRELAALPNQELTLDNEHIRYVTSVSTDLLSYLKSSTGLLKAEGEAGIRRLQNIALGVFIAQLLVLGATAAMIFYPMIQHLKLELTQRTNNTTRLEIMALTLRRHAVELERSNIALDQFASVVAHDLRAPLRNISTFAELLRNKSSLLSNPKDQEFVEIIQTAIKRMETLIADLLEFSRVTSRPQLFEEIELNDVINDVLSDLERDIQNNQASINVGSLPKIKADRTQIRQLFQNLLENSLKFRSPERLPLIKIYCEKAQLEERPAYKLVVEDNGIGFDSERAPQMFQIFRRLHGETYSGSGIGLATCRRIIERHHGLIQAESVVGHGAKFIIMLPIDSSAA